MKKVDYYRVAIELVAHDKNDGGYLNSNWHNFTTCTRRRAMSYYKTAIDYWSSTAGNLDNDMFDTAEINFVVYYGDGSIDIPFSEVLRF